MVLKLYASPISTCSRRVAMILHEKKVPFEFYPVNLAKGEQKDPAYVEHQPFGLVPYIDDDGFILYESRAICRYICDKYPDHGGQIVPTDTKGKALFEQAASVEFANFDPAAGGAIMEKVFKPMKGFQTDDYMFGKYVETLKAKLEIYETILGKQKFLAGDELTLVDLFHLPYGILLPKIGVDYFQTKPNLSRWWNEFSERESWVKVRDGIKGGETFA